MVDENSERKHLWWHFPKFEAHTQIFQYVQTVERRQSKIFDKFVKLAALYDPNSIRSDMFGRSSVETLGLVAENVIASNVDTVTAAIAATDVRARFMTDDADWSTQRLARHLEWYSEGVSKKLDLDEKLRIAFRHSALKGTGLLEIYVDEFDEIRVDLVPVDEIVVDEAECRDREPRQMHRRLQVDREELKAQYPEFAAEIDAAQSGANRTWRMWAGYRPLEHNELVLIRSWRLPIGVKGRKGYVPGREVWSIDGCTLVDRAYHKTEFPIVRMVWTPSVDGWYGISGAERIAGHQRALNKRNLQIDRQLDQGAFPTTYVRMIDAALSVRTINKLGTVAVYKGEKPETVFPPAVSSETYQSREMLKASAFEEFGVSRLAAQSYKPAGLESGEALREYKDQTTQRFAMQEKEFENAKLRAVLKILDCCKDLGDKAPEVLKRSKFGSRRIKWSDVDMTDAKLSIAAASTLSRTPAGRMQTVLEWAQAGVISQDEARRLLRHPDLERAMSIYTEALENVEHCLEEIADGRMVMPEPYMNLKMCVWRGQMQYLIWRDEGAPEEVLEGIRQFIVTAAYLDAQRNPAPMNGNMGALPGGADAGAAGAMPPGVDPNAPPPMPAGPPSGPAPVAAFAPQAMQVLAR